MRKRVENSWDGFMQYFIYFMVIFMIGMVVHQRITDPGEVFIGGDNSNNIIMNAAFNRLDGMGSGNYGRALIKFHIGIYNSVFN